MGGAHSPRQAMEVIMEQRESVVRARIDIEVMNGWVEAGWLAPRQNGTDRRFSEIDFARAQLIRDLQDLGVNDEGIPIILDLVDQVHGLRGMRRELVSTIKAQRQEQGRT
jgi:chaperone modulatory protein CbpM